jgi:integrase
MTDHHPQPVPETALQTLQQAAQAAEQFARAAKAPNTKRAYRASWNDFEAWCKKHDRESLPADPATVALYISDLASIRKVGTLGHRLAAIAVAHKMKALPNPASTREEPLRSVWAGIKRTKGQRKTQKAPLLRKHLQQIMAAMPVDQHLEAGRLRALRDRALLLVGFAGALRRSELVELQVQDLTFDERGMRVYIPRSKTDVSGEGAEIGIPSTGTATCPVRAVRAWTEATGISEGLLFRAVLHGGLVTASLSTKVVARVVKKYATLIGLDADGFGGHSLRAGLITSAAAAGAQEVDIMRHSRHKSVPVLRQYVRKATVWEDNAAVKALG